MSSICCCLCRLLAHARVIDGELCYADKNYFDIGLLFTARYELFKRVYFHKTSKAIDYMISDVLVLSDARLHTLEKTKSCEEYLTLRDSILDRVRDKRVKELPADAPPHGLFVCAVSCYLLQICEYVCVFFLLKHQKL